RWAMYGVIGGICAWLGWISGRTFEREQHEPGPEPKPIDLGGIALAIAVSGIPLLGLVGGMWLSANTALGGWGYLVGVAAIPVGYWLGGLVWWRANGWRARALIAAVCLIALGGWYYYESLPPDHETRRMRLYRQDSMSCSKFASDREKARELLAWKWPTGS